jgi:hypothetical protein
MSRLLIFGCFADDTQGVLAAVYQFADMLIKLSVYRLCGILDGKFSAAGDLELLIAIQANPQIGSAPDSLDDSQFALWHEYSLPLFACANEMAPVP